MSSFCVNISIYLNQFQELTAKKKRKNEIMQRCTSIKKKLTDFQDILTENRKICCEACFIKQKLRSSIFSTKMVEIF